ncbi:MAG: hypothetical protein ACM3ZV_07370 [Bacillota bacterium]
MEFVAALGELAGELLKGFLGVAKRVNIQGWIGIAGVLVLGVLLVLQKGETRHWRKQSGQFEQLYRAEVTAHQQTIGNYRAAAEQARAADKANAERVAAEARQINERTSHDYEVRIADARARADRLRHQLAQAGTHPGSGGATPVPGFPAPAGGSPEAAGEDGFSLADRLVATEQAIQLDELIKAVRKLAGIDVNGNPKAPPDGDAKR